MTLAHVRRLTTNLAEGLSGPGAPAAAQRLRRMLGARSVGLCDLNADLAWSGGSGDADAAAALIAEVLRTERNAAEGPVAAAPLIVDGALAGILLVDGPTPAKALKEAVRLIEHILDHGRLQDSAERAARSELRALRAEISPHFVYNALTVIASLVRSDPERSRELILDFADYARYSLARHGEYTTVADEFQAIETYLVLQRAVIGDRLRVQIRVTPDVLAVPLPYLVLQPLVENAIRHGIEAREGGGAINVHGEARDEDCVITIEDDGVGMDPAHAEAILAGKSTGSVGLSNVDRRLRTSYGSWYGLVVETERDAGTRVLVRVPLSQPGVLPS
ncbi:sensor histidine kinase [Nocardia alni]|uniref:sensor histidine kinase n=1 Tax=Nocardia alni TaxID=2815723 RepID=UPI001C212E7F|nr:histidine kinase [Nocardia alni]